MKEFHVDYSATPFWLFHSWLEVDEFRDLVVNTWNNDHIVNANDHQARLSSIDIKIDQVKAEFLDHSRNRFQQPTGIPSNLDSDMLNLLSQCHRDFLERPFSRDEIKSVVWDCGVDQASGPDGFMFKFFTSF
ncbi:hypothetical protein Tco_1559074 [Tanacetum coccineum]